ncbi:hypothetical protein RJ55_06215 [Drechmeria coniospora]|nr:hypothetical protein RJ55_06215 [Drechmeria coniospora]
MVKYTREGRASDMHVSLISQVGTQVRILRGCNLKSPLAPEAGIRYDGQYILRQYGQKLDRETGLHRLVLILERVPGQILLDRLVMIPRPSQLDDWHLFQRYEGEIMRYMRGEQGYLEWKAAEEEQKVDIGQWKQALGRAMELKLLGQGEAGR